MAPHLSSLARTPRMVALEPGPCRRISQTSRYGQPSVETKASSTISQSEVFSAYSCNARRAIQSILRDRDTETLVAEIDSLRVGFVVLQYERVARDFGPWARPTVARIDAIAVRPDIHGRGIGRRLLQSAEKAARRRWARSLSLATGEGNTQARRLFAAGGFVELARLERYYAAG
jgi:ribosomal protein S18 acetylase RimI-like enzyme